MIHRLSLCRRLAFLTLLALAVPGSLQAERPTAAAPADIEARMASWERHQALVEASDFSGLEWRSIGPVVQGGRVVDIETVPGQPYTFYVAYASGGLWRTTDNGVTFESIFEDQPTLIMGDIAVDPNRPKTLWVGSGENNSSRSSYGGMGVFRSDDGGDTWRHMGLGDSDRIGRIIIDPRDGDRIYVAVLGKLYTPGGSRGVFRSTDGGDTWEEVLAGDPDGYTGFIDLVIDPQQPDTLYAASWQRSRRPWNFVEGGEGSGIWKSTDGGDTWTLLDGGFPKGEHIGRIGLAVAASQPSTIYACVDHQEPLPEAQWDLGDGAVTAKRLRKMSKEEFLLQDPEEIEDFIRNNDLDSNLDAAKVIEMVENDELTLDDLLAELDDANANLFNTDIRGLEVWRSDDAGATWRRTHEEPIRNVVYTYGYYFGQIRVAPHDPERIYVVGVPAITSADGGATFDSLQGRDVHVDYHAMWIDPQHPDRVVLGNDGGLDVSYDGGQSWLGLDAQAVGQFYSIAVDMAEPYNVYGGLQDNGVLRGSSLAKPGLQPWQFIGGGDGMYVQVDPRDNATTYLGYQFGFYNRLDADGSRHPTRPRDALGEPALRYNWATPILLSEHNHDVLYFGANRLYRSLDRGETWQAISADLTSSQQRGDVPFGTLSTLAESPLRFGLLWTGSDDGQVHVSDDGGVEWRNVSGGLPADRWVSRVEASRFEEQRAYLSLNGYRDDDITAYLYVTEDLGATWKSLASGLPAEAINVVKEDPVSPEVLYVGTDRGVYVSLDRGTRWQALASGLPKVPVHDLVVHPRDRELVIGTHGRSVWILDALPIQELEAVRDEALYLFPVEEMAYQRSWKSRPSLWFDESEFLPELQAPFWAKESGPAEWVVLDSEDRELQRVAFEASAGVNTMTWDLQLDPDLAVAAESARLAAADDAKGEAKTRKRNKKAAPDPAPRPRAETPWAETLRLGRRLIVTPGTYKLEVRQGDAKSTIEWTMRPPEPRVPRAKERAKIRGEKDD